MPLGERLGDGNNSNLCGLELGFELELPEILAANIIAGSFDFVVAPLKHPSIRSSIEREFPEGLLYADSDLKFKPCDWRDHVVCKISSWINLDSHNEKVRMESEIALKQQIAWASSLTIEACLLPTPKGTSCVNYARCVSQILKKQKNMKLWLRIPLGEPEVSCSARPAANLIDSWETWNSFRLLCGHHSQLFIALDNLSALPSENSLKRWLGESVVAAIIHTESFLTKARGDGKYLPKRQQKLITDFFDHSIQIILTREKGTSSDPLDTLHIEGAQADPVDPMNQAIQTKADPIDPMNPAIQTKTTELIWLTSSRHPLLPYQEYISFLYQRMEPLPLQECNEFGIRDFLQSPFQPLKDLSEALNHENSEKDTMKYAQYKKAIRKALLDRVPDEKASEVTTVLIIVGAGRGPLVWTSLKAAEEVGREIKIYAVDKNINTTVSLNALICSNRWSNKVTIVTTDVRYWNAPETADIMVSELLGSFGDNELSNELLDGAQRFLKEDGISIPSSYTSLLQPLTASKLYNDVRSREDILNAETACVVKMHRVARLAPCQPVFTLTHPKRHKESNQRHKKLHFVIPNDTGSAMVHGFAAYFDATLYKDVRLGNEPSTATPNLCSWFPMFFPLRRPVCVRRGSALDVHFWRCYDLRKVWYEWCVTSPSLTPIHNCNGRSYWVSL